MIAVWLVALLFGGVFLIATTIGAVNTSHRAGWRHRYHDKTATQLAQMERYRRRL